MGVRFAILLDYQHDPNVLDRIRLTHTWGFDAESRFLNLGVGSRKQLSTVGGDPKGMSVVVEPTSICTLVGFPNLTDKISDRTGFITLEGVAEGDAEIRLVNAGGKTVDKVAIKVVTTRVVKVRFYNLLDGVGHKAITDPDNDAFFSPGALQRLAEAVNAIVGFQSDVFMALSGTGLIKDLTFSDNIGDQVNMDNLKGFISDLDPDAQYHVGFVWGISGPRSNGTTKTNFTLLKNGLGDAKRQVTLSHEFVHFLTGGMDTKHDHDDRQSDLMFESAPHGINMRKARLVRIIHG
jgi:hypothetical protein